jgi:hypothetical protein
MNKNADELLPCPFCGGVPEFKPYKRDGLTLQCPSLGCISFNQRALRYSLDWLRWKMIETWNTRPDARPQDGVAGLGLLAERMAVAIKENDAAELWTIRAHMLAIKHAPTAADELRLAAAKAVRECLDRDQSDDDYRPLELWIADSVLALATQPPAAGGGADLRKAVAEYLDLMSNGDDTDAGTVAAMEAMDRMQDALAQPQPVCDKHIPGYPCPVPASCRDNGCSAVERRDHATASSVVQSGEASPTITTPTTKQTAGEWQAALSIALNDDVEDVLRDFAEDPTGDNGVMVVREVMRVLHRNQPTPSEQPAVVASAEGGLSLSQEFVARATAPDAEPGPDTIGGSPERWKSITDRLAEEVDGYEYRGDEGDYTPNERERMLLLDFAMGLPDELFATPPKPASDKLCGCGRPAEYEAEGGGRCCNKYSIKCQPQQSGEGMVLVRRDAILAAAAELAAQDCEGSAAELLDAMLAASAPVAKGVGNA